MTLDENLALSYPKVTRSSQVKSVGKEARLRKQRLPTRRESSMFPLSNSQGLKVNRRGLKRANPNTLDEKNRTFYPKVTGSSIIKSVDKEPGSAARINSHWQGERANSGLKGVPKGVRTG